MLGAWCDDNECTNWAIAAHWIRNQSSQQFKASAELKADRRWCLTGTPIQNSLEDLRSLLKFLQLEPFANRSMFEKHILEPLRSDSSDGFRNLKILLGAICLRRASSYLNLPPTREEKVPVFLSHEESMEQSRILDDCQKQFDRVVSRQSSQKKHSIIFATVKKLQQLFSHGLPHCSYLSPDLSGRTSKTAPLDEFNFFCKLCSNDDEDVMALLESEAACPECSRELHNKSGPRQGSTPGSSVPSPGSISPSPGLPQHPQGSTENGPRVATRSSSTKLDAVVENLERHQAASKRWTHAS